MKVTRGADAFGRGTADLPAAICADNALNHPAIGRQSLCHLWLGEPIGRVAAVASRRSGGSHLGHWQ